MPRNPVCPPGQAISCICRAVLHRAWGGGCFLQPCAKADNRLVFIGSGMQRAAIRRALQSTFE